MISHQSGLFRDRGSNAGFAIAAFILLFCASYFWSLSELNSLDDMPGVHKDDVFYDNIAFNITERGEFALAFSDIQWLDMYSANNADGRYNWIFAIRADGLTTSRAPGFPYALAGCYYVFGREWSNIRLMNMFVLAFGLACLCATVRRFSGWIPAILATIIIGSDLFVMRTGGQIMTEAMATGVLALMFSSLICVWNHPTERTKPGWRWFVVGVLFGVAILIRSNHAAWLAQLFVIGIAGLVFVLIRRRSVTAFLQASALFLFGTVIVCLPWWARNCRTTGDFAPLGCGGIGMIGGYCDESFENRGNWSLEKALELQFNVMVNSLRNNEDLTMAEIEMKMAGESRDLAFRWAEENQSKLPHLMAMRVQSHLALHDGLPLHLLALNALLFFGAAIGIFGSWSRFGGWVALILILSIATTALTWAHEGRYSIPVRPIIAVAAAIGTVYFWSGVLKQFRGSRQDASG